MKLSVQASSAETKKETREVEALPCKVPPGGDGFGQKVSRLEMEKRRQRRVVADP